MFINALKPNFMKIKFENSIRRLSFLCRLQDIKIAWINPCPENVRKPLVFSRFKEVQNWTISVKQANNEKKLEQKKKICTIKIIHHNYKFH